MTDAEIARMGEYARQALDNPAMSEAIKRLHELALEQFKRTDIRDAEGLKLARQFAAVTDDFETILKRMVEGGRLAQLNLDKHRDEGAARRVVRKVLR
ncbi:MAG: hypothetical protein ACKOXL_00590 [Limnohabitans sp.]